MPGYRCNCNYHGATSQRRQSLVYLLAVCAALTTQICATHDAFWSSSSLAFARPRAGRHAKPVVSPSLSIDYAALTATAAAPLDSRPFTSTVILRHHQLLEHPQGRRDSRRRDKQQRTAAPVVAPTAKWRRGVKKVGLYMAKVYRFTKQRALGAIEGAMAAMGRAESTSLPSLLPVDANVHEPRPEPFLVTALVVDEEVVKTQRSDTHDPVAIVQTATPTAHATDITTESTPFTADSTHSQRWAVASTRTDLSGTWKPIVNAAFTAEYDDYLRKCGEGIWFRKTMLSVLGLAKEVIVQRKHGRELSITGVTPIGGWERTLVSSGREHDSSDSNNGDKASSFEPIYTHFRDPDGDTVSVEAWWEGDGSVHKSRLRNKPRLLGGEMESTRYLESDNVLVCESTFHPSTGSKKNERQHNQSKFQPAKVVWRFQRQ